MRILLAVSLALSSTTIWAQSVYKCGSTYSQTPCAHDAKPLDKPELRQEKPSAPVSQDKIERNIQSCIAHLKITLKDPDSALFKEPRRLGRTEGVNFNTLEKFPAILYAVDVNAKNSYGGYTGYKVGACYFDLSEETIKGYKVLLSD